MREYFRFVEHIYMLVLDEWPLCLFNYLILILLVYFLLLSHGTKFVLIDIILIFLL